MKFTTHFELHSQTTRLVEETSHGTRQPTRHGILTLCDVLFQGTWDGRQHRSHLSKLQLGRPKTPDFKFELLPLHSQLLRQSLLVSFPPLIDMLKFSGYPYLIRGQPRKIGGLWQCHLTFQAKENLLRRGTWGSTPLDFESE